MTRCLAALVLLAFQCALIVRGETTWEHLRRDTLNAAAGLPPLTPASAIAGSTSSRLFSRPVHPPSRWSSSCAPSFSAFECAADPPSGTCTT